MKLWTNGRTHLVVTGRGFARLADQRTIHRFPPPGPGKRDVEPPFPRFLAVLDDDAKTLVFGRPEGWASATLGKQGFEVQEHEGATPLAVVSLGGAKAAALVAETTPDGAAWAALHHAELSVERGVLVKDAAPLPPSKRVTWWKDAIWESGEVPWPEDEDDELDFSKLAMGAHAEDLGKLRLTANRHGVVATSTQTGIVAVWDAASLAPRFAIRVPAQDEAEIYAHATPEGVFVVLTIEGRDSALLHAAPDGKLIAKRHKLGKDLAYGVGDPLVLGPQAYVTHAETVAKTYAVSLPELGAKASKDFEGDKTHILYHAVADDGEAALVVYGDPAAGPHKWELALARPGEKKLKLEELIIPDFRSLSLGVGGDGPKRMEGPPALGLANKERSWRTNLGEPFTLAFDIPSNGGPGTGLFFELSGDVLKNGLLKPVEIKLGDVTAPFQGSGASWKVELPQVPIEAAFAASNPRTKQVFPQSNTKLSAVVRFESVAKGQGLLMVRVGPLAATGRSGSAMDGRTVTVA